MYGYRTDSGDIFHPRYRVHPIRRIGLCDSITRQAGFEKENLKVYGTSNLFIR